MYNSTHNDTIKMSDNESGGDDNVFVRDIIIPCIFLLVMLITNAFLFAYIMYKRKDVVWEDPSIYQACLDTKETTSREPAGTTAQEASVTLEMEQLRQ